MQGIEIALVMALKVLVLIAFLVVIAAAVAGLNRVIPDGEVKTFLFRVRGRPGAETPDHERLAVRSMVVTCVVGLVLFISWLAA